MNSLPLMLGTLLILTIAYRYYSAFIAAKVLALDPKRPTPAHTLYDGQNYYPTNRWVLFGHHFAAIAGAGPLVGPVLAAQFGYVPSFLWLLAGVVIAGAVHDLVSLTASVRRDGKSLAEIARMEIGPVAGFVTAVAILFIVVIALAGLGMVVVNALAESSWGTFTIAMSIPVALLVGWWMYVFRKGKIVEASMIGVVLMILFVYLGAFVPGSFMESWFTFDRHSLTLLMAGYGFIASVLPVWILLCPRDYISSYMKLGTIGALVLGILVVHPDMRMPAFSRFLHGQGPIIHGNWFPFLFITIACGAISGFHALVASGTTPKMIDNERDIRPIGYGAMLLEGLVGIVALIAVSALHEGDYYQINATATECARIGMTEVNLPALCSQVGENLHGRTGGAVSLAVGMAQIFAGIPGFKKLVSYWYHFAIMFEALFILTTIDTGTRVARFILQEFLGRFYKPMAKTDWLPGTVVTSAAIVAGWSYFIWTGNISTIWPMFGVANQLLASAALAIGTTIIIKSGKARFAWVTLIPLAFVTTTTLSAGWLSIQNNFLPLAQSEPFRGYLNASVTAVMMVCVIIILADAARTWVKKYPKHKSSIAK